MARRKRVPPLPSAPAAAARSAARDPVVLLLCLVAVLAPALGAPTELLLQDTLKSMVVAAGALSAGLLFFWRERAREAPLRWHAILVMPLVLLLASLASMAWSHAYLAGVEAVRWFLFALLLFLALQVFGRDRLQAFGTAVHLGAVLASLYVLLQFWFDWSFFPQGPRPASTFINRNFFAEFAVSAMPFGFLLLARANSRARVCALALGNAVVVLAILMTGTRSALVALELQLLVLLPWIAWRYRRRLAVSGWDRPTALLAVAVMLAVVGLGGIVPTGSAQLAAEQRGVTALERAVRRTQEIRLGDNSINMRRVMWRATLRMIEAHPLLGVGAGAWENEVPLYLDGTSQLEVDYYAHNEYLQLVSEFGLAGALVLAGLACWLLASAWRTLRLGTDEQGDEAAWRAILLTSLLALLIVSGIGFPWRMAATGALFALSLGALAASDARLGFGGRGGARPLAWRPEASLAGFGLLAIASVLAVFVSRQAVLAENRLVSAARLALAISASANPQSPRWNATKARMLAQVREGIAINPHYRKITPMVADELARWGDWRNAIWVWESVRASRPNIVAIQANIARGYAMIGQRSEALANLERARQLRPDAPAVRSLEVVLLEAWGDPAQARARARDALDRGIVDFDLVEAALRLARGAGDWPLALRAAELRLQRWPERRVESLLLIAQLYDTGLKDPVRALDSYRKAVDAAPANEREAVRARVPLVYRGRLPDGASAR